MPTKQYKIAFCSDLHFNFLDSDDDLAKFATKVDDTHADCLVIAGDITEAPLLKEHIEFLDTIGIPVYYVHGNHDFYKSTIGEVKMYSGQVSYTANCKWLEGSGPIRLTNETCICGVDGWYDLQHGTCFNYQGRFTMEMTDFEAIRDFRGTSTTHKYQIFQKLAGDAAKIAKKQLKEAFVTYDHVVFVTHVPPFREVSYYNGNPSSEQSVGFYTSKTMGDALLEISKEFSDKNLTVLCGHTHDPAWYVNGNIESICAVARYSHPSIHQVIKVK